MADKNENWKWHLWRKDRETNLKSYCGFFYDEKGAIANKKARAEADPEGIYAILDYGPLQLAKRAEKTPITTQRVGVKAHQPSATATQAMAEARAESRRRDAEQQTRRKAKSAADKARKEQDDKDMAGIRADAAGLVEKHKKDEADDLAKGINR